MSFTKLVRIGRDAEIRYMSDGTTATNLSMAYNYGKSGADGKKPTQWLDGALFGKIAESLAPYLLKGTQIVVTVDDLHIETYQGKNGEGHKLAGRISRIDLVDRKETAQQQRPAPAPRPAAPKQGAAFSDMDDDIQF